jgi:hypothetical protein
VAWHTFKENHSKWSEAAFARIEAALERDGKFEGKKWNITFCECERCGDAKASVAPTSVG